MLKFWLLNFRASRGSDDPAFDPIRSELFSIERLEHQAESLAAAQGQIAPRKTRGRNLLPRIKSNHRVLVKAYEYISRAIIEERAITPAAEWLVDNFYIVEDQLREIHDDLPPAFYRKLPKLTTEPFVGLPRVYGLAWTFIAHTDSRLDREWLRRFIKAYQRLEPLQMGEVWAFAINLRIVLVENLRRLAERIMRGRAERRQADNLADALLGLRGKTPANPATLLHHYEGKPLRRAFAVQLLHRLRDQDARAQPVLEWLETRLAVQNTTPERIIRAEHQAQTGMNATVRNIITSMRLLSAMDWTRFFEDVSVVDEILRARTAFAEMDFPTRDLYRHAIEELARGSGLAEPDVTRRVVDACQSRPEDPAGESVVERERRADPGYYLISTGRLRFEKDIEFKVMLRDRLVRLYRAWATPGYLSTIGVATGLALAVPLVRSAERGENPLIWSILALLAVVPASDLAIALVNRIITELIKPKLIPKLDFSNGIPSTAPTLVMMPTLLSNFSAIEDQLTHLETHYLGNSDGHLQFALVTDWPDAAQESEPGDGALARAAEEGIAHLNEQYGPGPDGSVRFLLLHRRRLWNPSEGVWMGWERKRGKIHELNRLLRGDTNTTFILAIGNLHRLRPDVRTVITLDADTRMSRGAVYRLAGAMAHPLNRPSFDRKARRVLSGYAIMQPRITPVLPLEAGSLYQRIFSGPAGIDPYAFAVSDVYQDLFNEGSYVGKGIYDVDAFESALRDRVPDNTMLSHDLYEGLYGRTALVSDVEFFDEFPSLYEAAAARLDRWMRGDWQLLPTLAASRLPWIGRWKILDNLRRSLSAPAAFALLIAVLWSDHPWVWLGFLLTCVGIPALLPALLALLPNTCRASIRHHYRGVRTDFIIGLAQILLFAVFLAHQTWLSINAIGRTLIRLFVSRRHLLQWVSFAETKNVSAIKLSAFYRRMVMAPVLALPVFSALAWRGLMDGAAGLIFLLALVWLGSPWAARRMSAPVKTRSERPLNPQDRQLFRLIARRTWRFFETFVDAQNNFLPPDNFQEVPHPVVARRTSPTNIGLYVLSTVAAHDLGWAGLLDTLDRLDATVATVKKLKRYEGHLFNWYDTQDLRPLEPLYVSTVDSGNLAGHLLTLASACRELKTAPVMRTEIFEGARDTLALIVQTSLDMTDLLRTGTVTIAHWKAAVDSLTQTLTPVRLASDDWRPRLVEAVAKAETLIDVARALGGSSAPPETLEWCDLLLRQLRGHLRDFDERANSDGQTAAQQRCDALVEFCTRTVQEMNFKFLFDPIKKIFSIGYLVTGNSLDASYYDLLASEARLASFIAIAKGDVPSLHWFRLARSFVSVEGGLALLSWSGSMFEYLMPSLVMREPPGSLLQLTAQRIVKRQIRYGAQKKVPWGISESGYNARDMDFTYQYSNFGVPGLGLKRGLSKDLLISPYATALAAMVDPTAAAANFKRLSATGAEGAYGYYEALDYTTVRLPEDQKVAVVRAYMAHHQGMTLVALSNLLCDGVMRRRFHGESLVKAAELLLQERMPRNAGVARLRSSVILGDTKIEDTSPLISRQFESPHDSPPRTHLLSNGRYSVMLTAAGSGYSGWRNLAVTRWREEATKDARGTFIFLRDVESGEVWSAGYQPRGVEPDRYLVDFSDDKAEFVRRDGDILSTLEVVISPEDDAEIRRVTLKNDGDRVRTIELTSYAEMVLASPAADLAHPVFSNLFVETEFVPSVNGLLCTRRPRSTEEPRVWAAHVMATSETSAPIEYESDRARFLGRGREIRTPMSVLDGKPLTNTAGPVLDPIVSLRQRVSIAPGKSVKVAFSTLISSNKEKTLALADKYHDPAMFERTLTLAWTQTQVQRHYLGAEIKDLHLFQELARRLLYPHADMRAAQELLKKNSRGPNGLWPYGISGDLPIVLVRIDEPEDKEIVRQLLRAHEYWRMKNLDVDMVILNEKAGSYQQELQDTLEGLVRAGQASLSHHAHEPHGGVFILRADRLPFEDRILLLAASRVTLLSHHGTLADQLERHERPFSRPVPTRRKPVPPPVAPQLPSSETLEFFNGLGGFAKDGQEYRTVLGAGQWTPAPWINVVANPSFGFMTSESGSGYTWSENSRENKLTPWSNDPVSDTPGEVFYVRDEHTNQIWTPTTLPIREEKWPYIATHGQGYSRFEHESHGIHLDLFQFVPPEDPVKISRLKITNRSNRTRLLSVTAYVEWVLGVSGSASAPHIVTERDEKTGAIFARNAWNTEFANRVAFADLAGKQTEWTADRTEFLGRNGSLDHPAALERGGTLLGRAGAGFDPCAALQTTIEIPAGKSTEVVFFLGQAASRQQGVELVRRWRAADLNKEVADVRKQWDDLLGTVQVRTPDRAMDVLLNRWLPYQTISCRLWARAGFYQAGGAYGFRDQLQDALSMVATKRDLARDQILRAAARQFPEGDVQHWWHSPSGRGVRTKITDDLLWLPYSVAHYIEVTGEFGILDEMVPFVQGPTVPEGKEDAYFEPTVTPEQATLFDHCARALDRSLNVGAHGLPLMGSGDWNDGMNRVGHGGKGESVWLAWFLHSILWEFAKIADRRGETERAQVWRLHVSDLKTAVERAAWDGEWYKRAFFDDGAPLGSSANAECRIDALAQSWAVLSGAADPARAAMAMASLEKNLIRRKEGLVLLFTPPFENTQPSPGYIQGYPRGVRENGGQYTHAAVWSMMAFAALGNGDKAGELFSLLNPIRRSGTRADIHRYKVEPYVMAGDVYSEPPHTGRGGWTWYTGSAGWMFRAGIESILGFRLRGTKMFMDPCIPHSWPSFSLSFRYHASRYDVVVENPNRVSRGVKSATVDGHAVRGGTEIHLVGDGQVHQIKIVMG